MRTQLSFERPAESHLGLAIDEIAATMIEYTVKRGVRPYFATVLSQGHDIAGMRSSDGGTFFLVKSYGSWKMNPRVHGEIRPFSMCVTSSEGGGDPVLTILNHLFFYRKKAYYLTGIPEDVRPADHLLGKRHVNRLDTFPFSSLDDVDPETWGRLRMHRGLSVGTIEATESGEYRVTLSEELEEVGVPLAASSYLLYTSG